MTKHPNKRYPLLIPDETTYAPGYENRRNTNPLSIPLILSDVKLNTRSCCQVLKNYLPLLVCLFLILAMALIIAFDVKVAICMSSVVSICLYSGFVLVLVFDTEILEAEYKHVQSTSTLPSYLKYWFLKQEHGFQKWNEINDTSILSIDIVWFSLVLWHINHCRLFNTKSIFIHIIIIIIIIMSCR